MNQRKTEWLNSKDDRGYHEKQFEKPYRSTEVFVEWLDDFFDAVNDGDKICDLACGKGANLAYLLQKYPGIDFEGIEINKELVNLGNKKLKMYTGGQNRIFQGDWYHLNSDIRNRYKGIISFQTLSWLPEYNEAIRCIAELNPDWIAISSLFYEGGIDYTIELKDYTRGSKAKAYEECYYNIYSLVKVKELFAELGYTQFKYKRYDIDIDLPKPEKEGLGTYTRKMEDGSRIQISAGLMLPWYFIIAYK